jgi:hypothetical protein
MGAYVSRAQQRKFHAMAARGEVSEEEVETRDKASKGKKLPEKKKKDRIYVSARRR